MSAATETVVEAGINYLVDTGERPAYWLYETKPGYIPPPPEVKKHQVRLHDIRPRMADCALDVEGFSCLEQPLPAIDFLDGDAVKTNYYPKCTQMVMNATGAREVLAFDHNVRDQSLSVEKDSGVREPVRFAHNDYTETSGPQRVRDLMGERAEDLLQGRFQFINVWRPLRGPVSDQPLAICDAQSITPQDFIATDLKYADRTGEVFSVRHNPRHHWVYINQMRTDEVILLKCFDSLDEGQARYTAHCAFRHPAADSKLPTRRSIEVRTIAFF